jgi:hypothetical protein
MLAVALLLGYAGGCVGGCANQEQKKFDAWYPPGSTRQHTLERAGTPWLSVVRPGGRAANPTSQPEAFGANGAANRTGNGAGDVAGTQPGEMGAENPTDTQWLAALNAAHPWAHPAILLDDIHAVEQRTHTAVARVDAFSAPGHRSTIELVYIHSTDIDLVFYDSADKVLASGPLPNEAYED